MPGSFLSEVERDRLNRFPSLIPDEDLITFFTLSDSDKTEVKKQRGDHNRFGFALQICTIRYLGFLPQDFSSAPIEAVLFVGQQLHLQVECLADYGRRFQTRQDHLKSVLSYLRFRRANQNDWKNLRTWLIERALEHDKPTLLLEFACEYLHMNKIMRPGITRLEGLVIEARQKTWSKTYMQLESILDKSMQTMLDGLLIPDAKIGKTPLVWLRQGATSNSARDILNSLNKIYFLRSLGADNWDLSLLNPNRLRFLAQVGRRSTNQYLQRLFPERRYPILIAFLRQSLIDITDEAVEVFNQILWDLYGDARDDLDKFQKGVSRSKDKNLKLFRLIIPVLLTPDIEEADVRSIIFTQVPAKDLVRAYEELSMIVRENDGHFDFFAKRYSYIQQFGVLCINRPKV